MLWTAFSAAFAAIFSTLFIPLSLAALGIVLRGAGLRVPQDARRRSGAARLAERCSGSSSLLTPFFMGTVVGAIASGRVPVGNAAGDPVTSWLNPLSLLIGALFVATAPTSPRCSWSATPAAPARPISSATSRTRALGAAVVAGALAVAGHRRAPRRRALHLRRPHRRRAAARDRVGRCAASRVLVLLRRGARRGARPLAVGAVGAVIWGWGVAQYPYLLPKTLTIADGAAPSATLTAC